jgi:hypothetical protein
MLNQHQLILGERDLTEEEITTINKIKGLSTIVGGLIQELEIIYGIDKRLLAIAKTNLQTGFMFATRSVEKPTSF